MPRFDTIFRCCETRPAKARSGVFHCDQPTRREKDAPKDVLEVLRLLRHLESDKDFNKHLVFTESNRWKWWCENRKGSEEVIVRQSCWRWRFYFQHEEVLPLRWEIWGFWHEISLECLSNRTVERSNSDIGNLGRQSEMQGSYLLKSLCICRPVQSRTHLITVTYRHIVLEHFWVCWIQIFARSLNDARPRSLACAHSLSWAPKHCRRKHWLFW